MIHLWLFPLLTLIIVIFPIVTRPKKENNISKKYFIFPNKTNSFETNNIFSKIHFLLSIFEYLFQNNFAVRFFWLPGFISWIISSFFWVLKIEIFSSLLLVVSVVFCLVVLYDVSKLNLEYFANVKLTQIGFSIYILIFSISILVMVSFNSLAGGITTNLVLLAFTPHLQMLKNNRNAALIQQTKN